MPEPLPYRTRWLLRFFIITALFVLVGCSTVEDPPSRAPTFLVHLTDDTRTALLPPQNIEHTFDEVQHITAEFQGERFAMTAILVADDTSLHMVGFGDMGQELFALDYSRESLAMKGLVLTESLLPAYIVMDLQLVYYDSRALEERLAASGLQFREIREGARILRQVFRNEKLVLEAVRTDGMITLTNYLRGYSYVINRGTAQ